MFGEITYSSYYLSVFIITRNYIDVLYFYLYSHQVT